MKERFITTEKQHINSRTVTKHRAYCLLPVCDWRSNACDTEPQAKGAFSQHKKLVWHPPRKEVMPHLP